MNARFPSGAAAGTLRTRRFRERQRQGRAVFAIELDELALVDALTSAGLLDEQQADDYEAIERGLQRMVELLLWSRA